MTARQELRVWSHENGSLPCHSRGQATEMEGSAGALGAVQRVGERRFSWLGRGTRVGSKQGEPRGGGPQQQGKKRNLVAARWVREF